jgi:hypothetical protein
VVAFSVEAHTYLTARRFSKNLHTLGSPVLDKVVRRATKRDLIPCLIGLIGLVGLLGFSMWNQLNYLLQTWTPNHILGPPPMASYVIRAAAVPLFFLFAALMAPQTETIGERRRRWQADPDPAHSRIVMERRLRRTPRRPKA